MRGWPEPAWTAGRDGNPVTGAETGGLLDNRRLMGFAFLAPAVVYIALLIGVPFVTRVRL